MSECEVLVVVFVYGDELLHLLAPLSEQLPLVDVVFGLDGLIRVGLGELAIGPAVLHQPLLSH